MMLQTLKLSRVLRKSSESNLSSWLFKINKMCTCKPSENVGQLRDLFQEAVKSVQPNVLIQNQIKLLDGHLSVNGQTFPLSKPCHAVGFGKAVLGMAIELEQVLGNRLERAIVAVPKGIFENYPQYLKESEKIAFIEGAENNIPDQEAVVAAKKIKELVESLGEDDLLIVLISGGGSALLPLPKPPITLEEKQDIIKALSRGGATIQELNTVRKQLSILKGGGLAKLAHPAKVISLILSDIVGDPVDLIASGPTVLSGVNPQEAVNVLEKYTLYDSAPESIKSVLQSVSEIQSNDYGKDSVTPGQTSTNDCGVEKSFPSGKSGHHVSNFIIGTNMIATQAAKDMAERMGWQCVIMSHQVEEEVNVLAEQYARLAYHIINGSIVKIREHLESLPFKLEENAIDQVIGLYGTKKSLLIFAGEPTVKVTSSGKGGRNQQLALAFSLHLNKLAASARYPGNISLLSAGTDGIDGPTDAAGAIGYSGLVENSSNINPEEYLENNDSYSFFNAFRNGECMIKIGHTGTNVMDLHFLLIEPIHMIHSTE